MAASDLVYTVFSGTDFAIDDIEVHAVVCDAPVLARTGAHEFKIRPDTDTRAIQQALKDQQDPRNRCDYISTKILVLLFCNYH